MQRGITLEQKRRYLKEVDGIHALSKKVRPPQGKSWSDIADDRFRKVMNMPLRMEVHDPIVVEDGGMHHEHSPRSARLIERTLRSGLVHPEVLHHYHTGAVRSQKTRGELRFLPRQFPVSSREPQSRREGLRHDDARVQHVVQHPGDLDYPHGHMQGVGFIPKNHTFASHVPVSSEAAPQAEEPTGDSFH